MEWLQAEVLKVIMEVLDATFMAYQQTRYHWMICETQNPDELISWGYSPTQEQAETEARNEVNDLLAGLTQGGQRPSTVKAFTHSRYWHETNPTFN